MHFAPHFCTWLVLICFLCQRFPSEPTTHPQKDTLINKELALKFFHDITKRVHEAVLWFSAMPRSLLYNSRISYSDVHIVVEVLHFLNQTHQHIHTHESGVQKFRSLLTHGYQCTPVQTRVQKSIHSHPELLDICSEIEWYKLAHLAWPQARTIMDVGANKGYLGALFLGLWGGGGLNVSPRVMYNIAMKDNLFAGAHRVEGYCEDGYDQALPLFCANHSRDFKTGKCKEEVLSVSVHSVEGNPLLAKLMQNVIANNMTHQNVKSGKSWKYYNYALSDSEGTVEFTKSGDGQNFLGWEGGRIESTHTPNRTVPVAMTTVDALVKSQNIPSLDILKIDAEGFDMNIVRGAAESLSESIGLLTFENQAGREFNFSFVDQMDRAGFSCFGTSKLGLLKFNGGCLPRHIDISKFKANIFCASRTVAPLLALLYDVVSFPLLFQNAFDKNTTAHREINSIRNEKEYDRAIADILESVRIDRREK